MKHLLIALSLVLSACSHGGSNAERVPSSTQQAQQKQKQIEDQVLSDVKSSYLNADANPAEAQRWNEALLLALDRLPMTGADRGRMPALNPMQMNELYQKATTNRVADYSKVKKWDPDGNIGFCFGRAMNAHIEALRYGVAKEAIRKIWAVGSMKYDNIYWQFHVATIVRGVDGTWYTIDPEYDKVLSLREWWAEVKKMDARGNLQMFSSRAGRFAVSSNVGYSPIDMNDDFYNGYFQELLKASREEASEVLRQRHERAAPQQ